ncbi:glutamine-hydrolyzing carbamoyl-phosphate synthase small subunit [Clostridiisalibacter paucivorans]|uniref:glutamine-hydrolyzing carbamoyl-phosphate synthase small subunit n=1 Tax=Clostridiisalibacter paucivorans TaxID=408753 RepID=UPI00047DBC36|nr:glutamine-hydrolyzing carbamoyl-phosphate synthase small subunit [Clostridiisalibacter paucivorans]
MKAKLILENGMIFEGNAFGYLKESVGEVVFNTGMTGYQEILTDPSYYGQIVTLTYPLIGNYGINLDDMESNSPKVNAIVVREYAKHPNNFRCEMDLEGYLKSNSIIGLYDIDTRALTRTIRDQGTMKGIIALRDLTESQIKNKFDNFSNKRAVDSVTTKEVYQLNKLGKNRHVAIIDFGIKESIIKGFLDRDCKVTVFSAKTTSDEILSYNPDLIFLSNGPGDPKDLECIPEVIRILSEYKPIAGICLGHQLMALSFGANTVKLKFGHRGCNHPVKDISTEKIYITSQNHGYVVEKVPEDFHITHISLNDNTIEGMAHNTKNIFTIQFHPEASPGPVECNKLFDKFIELASEGRN